MLSLSAVSTDISRSCDVLYTYLHIKVRRHYIKKVKKEDTI